MKLQDYVKDYGYEITKEQAREILEMLEDYAYCSRYTSDEIIICTEYVLYKDRSRFYKEFN